MTSTAVLCRTRQHVAPRSPLSSPDLCPLTGLNNKLSYLYSASIFHVQVRPPVFRKIGCPKPDLDISDFGCFAPRTSCLPSGNDGVPMGKLRNLYRIVRARSWWHCGKNTIICQQKIITSSRYCLRPNYSM